MAKKTKISEVNKYEGMFLLGPAVADPEAQQKLVRAVVEKHGGTVLVLKRWDERKLAYEVGKQKRGTYIICYFSAQPSAVSPLERDVRLGDDFLRILVTKADHLTQAEMEAVEPQPIVKEERPAYGDFGGFGGGGRDFGGGGRDFGGGRDGGGRDGGGRDSRREPAGV